MPTPSNCPHYNDPEEQRNFRYIAPHVCERPSLVRLHVVTEISTHQWGGPFPTDELSIVGAYVPIVDVDVSDAALDKDHDIACKDVSQLQLVDVKLFWNWYDDGMAVQQQRL